MASVCGIVILTIPYLIRTISLPSFLQDKKTILALLLETVSVLVIIAVVGVFSNRSDYWKTALPIAFLSLIFLWFVVLIARYSSGGIAIKLAKICFISGILALFFNDFVDRIIGNFKGLTNKKLNLSVWSGECLSANIIFIVSISLMALSVFLALIGKINSKS